MTFYLAYDIRGIQTLIFSIPKLKAIIGGSAVIDEFDEAVKRKCRELGGVKVFAGGGRGVVKFTSADSRVKFEVFLRQEAHEYGLDLQLGDSKDIRTVVAGASRLYTFVPDNLDGPPCSVSGLYPVAKDGKTHPLVHGRITRGRKDNLGKSILDAIKKSIKLPESVSDCELKFFRDVNPRVVQMEDDESDEVDRKEDSQLAEIGKLVIGNRGRWAVVVMDGNGLGTQFESMAEANHLQFEKWLEAMSRSLAECTKIALNTALVEAIIHWVYDANDSITDYVCVDRHGKRFLLLPFRPLIRGGDDIAILLHPRYAIAFVRNLARQFHCESENAASEYSKKNPNESLWPATENQLTMSAGVLFTQTTMPLHTALQYADELLANAKSKFRGQSPMPGAIDFEVATESFLDSPVLRRARELEFVDSEINANIHLGRRPYVFEGDGTGSLDSLFEWIELFEKLPRSLLSQLLQKMRAPWSERFEYLVSIAKRHPKVFELLSNETHETFGKMWERDKSDKTSTISTWVTCLADVVALIGEDTRMKQGSRQNSNLQTQGV